MKAVKECYSCLSNLIHNAVNMATDDPDIRKLAIEHAKNVLDFEFSPEAIPMGIATKLHQTVKIDTKNPDPYRKLKDGEINYARVLFDHVKTFYKDTIDGALKLAVLGNSMDFFRPLVDIEKDNITKEIKFGIDHANEFIDKAKEARKILYLADNAGEVFFDLPLLNKLKEYAPTIYVVKARPVLE